MKKKSRIKKDDKLGGFPLRLPSYLKLWLGEIAKPQKRSINSEIILILEEKYNAAIHKNKV